MRNSLGIAVGIATLAFGFAACSSSPSDKYPDEASYCDAKAKEECQVAAQCAATVAACTPVRARACTIAGSQSRTGGRTFSPSAVQTCIDKTHEAYVTGVISPTALAAMTDACERVFAGTTQANQPCDIDYDCAGTMVCDKKFCAKREEKKSNEPCANPGDICAAGFYCGAANSGLLICLPKARLGDNCTQIPCLEDLRCDPDVCAPRQTVGQQCTTSDDCAADAPYCDPNAKNVCDKGVTFSPGASICHDYGA